MGYKLLISNIFASSQDWENGTKTLTGIRNFPNILIKILKIREDVLPLMALKM